ncbi:MAG: hypothetical protein LBI78_02360 [Campylobacteraceae bacterium]|jgi:hypothetical protein|nr:hypothetical protein [Campylobacteraceae bacterium]
MSILKVINPNIQYRLPALQQLKVAKHISPNIFENKTPLFHIDLLTFINGEEKYKAAAVFRGSAKTTLLNKVNIFCRVFFEHEPLTIITSDSRDKAESFLSDIKDMFISASNIGYAISKGAVWTKEEVHVTVNKDKKDADGKSLEEICIVISISVGTSPRGFLKKNMRPTLIVCDEHGEQSRSVCCR